jgi:hypothetical protein
MQQQKYRVITTKICKQSCFHSWMDTQFCDRLQCEIWPWKPKFSLTSLMGPWPQIRYTIYKYLVALTKNIGTSVLLSLVFQWYFKCYYIWKNLPNPAQAFTPCLFMIKFTDSFYQLSLCLPLVLHKALLLSLLPEFSDCNPLLHGTVELLISVGNIQIFPSL